jgi:peroxiredoxin
MLKRIMFVILVVIPVTTILTMTFSNFNSKPVENYNPGKIQNFTLKDVYGKEHSLSDYKDAKVIVIMFIATECPISLDYDKRMTKISNQYIEKNIAFIGINSNKQESINDCKEHAEKNGFKFSVLKDEGNKIADMFGASVTPEIYILNPADFEILYHGRIDDSRKESGIEKHDLINALDEILAGKKVSNPKTKAFGCTIKRV